MKFKFDYYATNANLLMLMQVIATNATMLQFIAKLPSELLGKSWSSYAPPYRVHTCMYHRVNHPFKIYNIFSMFRFLVRVLSFAAQPAACCIHLARTLHLTPRDAFGPSPEGYSTWRMHWKRYSTTQAPRSQRRAWAARKRLKWAADYKPR